MSFSLIFIDKANYLNNLIDEAFLINNTQDDVLDSSIPNTFK